MDKFGVFNLLSSLLTKTQQENTTTPNNFSTPNQEKSEQVSPRFSTPLPLQADMIKTMTSHDEFIKRVKQKNKT